MPTNGQHDHTIAISSLHAAGLRVTASRLAVFEALSEQSHVTAGAVASKARGNLGSVSTQAVYNALDAFTEAGIARRIEPAGSPALYETRTGDNHHHLVCRRCGGVTDVDCLSPQAPCLTPTDVPGFAVDEAEIVFWGHCPECLIAAAPEHPPHEPPC
jgi:Fe2+ or Zn2+ uptake regulation protein